MSYRKLASILTEAHNKWGAAIVSVRDEEDLLEDVTSPTLQLRVKEEAPLYEIQSCHLTLKKVRKAFWELREEKEWDMDRGVVWSSVDGDSSFIGLATMVPSTEPMPALTRVVTTGGEEPDGRADPE
jgi:hypothetical protein